MTAELMFRAFENVRTCCGLFNVLLLDRLSDAETMLGWFTLSTGFINTRLCMPGELMIPGEMSLLDGEPPISEQL